MAAGREQIVQSGEQNSNCYSFSFRTTSLYV